MSGSFVSEANSRLKYLTNQSCRGLVVVLPCLITLLSSTVVEGQLRSGRVERQLYEPTTQVERDTNTTSRKPEVVAASHSESSRRTSVAAGPAAAGQAAVRAKRGAGVIAASATHYAGGDCGCDACAGGSLDLGCDSLGCGCGDLACDGCHQAFANIAPTCATLCPPGGGSLMALWCRLSVRAEAPLYWRRAAGPPALVTTATTGTVSTVAGQLGQATTQVLLGDDRLNEDLNVGLRLTFSTWLGQSQDYGLMFRYWNAGDQDDTYNFDSNSFPILARPFFNTTVAGSFSQDTQLIAFPSESVGGVQVATRSAVDGLELTLRRRLYQDRFTRLDWLYGYQHVGIDEGLSITSQTTVTGNTPGLQGAMISVSDLFETENSFHGVSYGLMSSRHFGAWKLETLFRLGAGNLRRKVNIAGSTTTVAGGATSTEAQGLLARNTNNRPFADDTFVVVPEVGVNFAYYLRPGIDFSLGYNFLMVPKVAQASQQINDDLRVNLSDPLTGTLDPELNFDERNYWLHSLGLGLQLRY